MDGKKILEERLREATFIGDIDAVQELINLGVDVNTRHSTNGWTPLHWACRRGFFDIATLLLRYGADRTIKSEAGDIPVSLCNNPQLIQLLNTSPDPPVTDSSSHTTSRVSTQIDHSSAPTDACKVRKNSSMLEELKISSQNELVLKIRIANAPDPDFVEIELPANDLTYEGLIRICCEEFGLTESQILKIRKLPNTKLRKDKDIQRLQNFQEIEVVTDASISVYKCAQNSNGIPTSIPTVPANGYQMN